MAEDVFKIIPVVPLAQWIVEPEALEEEERVELVELLQPKCPPKTSPRRPLVTDEPGASPSTD